MEGFPGAKKAKAVDVAPNLVDQEKKLTKAERKAARKAAKQQDPFGATRAKMGDAAPIGGTLVTEIKEVAQQDTNEPSLEKFAKQTAEAALRNALNTFLTTHIKLVVSAFSVLFASHKTEGDSSEAMSALNAVRLAFDACNLVLSDVVTSKPPKNDVAQKTEIQTQMKMPPKEFPKSEKEDHGAAAKKAFDKVKVKKEEIEETPKKEFHPMDDHAKNQPINRKDRDRAYRLNKKHGEGKEISGDDLAWLQKYNTARLVEK